MLKKLLGVFSILILMISSVLVSCSDKNVQQNISGGIKINSWSSCLGAVDNSNLDKTKFSYFVNLTNESHKDVFISSIQPIVNESIKNKIISKDLFNKINRNIKTYETIEIKGDIVINTKEMGKSEISSLEPLVTDVKVYIEEILKVKN